MVWHSEGTGGWGEAPGPFSSKHPPGPLYNQQPPPPGEGQEQKVLEGA